MPLYDAMARSRISHLRALRPMPFGVDQPATSRLSVSLGSESMNAGMFGVAALGAAIRRSPLPLADMSLRFGSLFDPTAPLLEVTTHWDGERCWARGS